VCPKNSYCFTGSEYGHGFDEARQALGWEASRRLNFKNWSVFACIKTKENWNELNGILLATWLSNAG